MGQARRTHAPTKIAAAAPSDAPEQQFLRLMSHEMRTPLNGVIGMLGLLSRTKLDGAQRAYAEAASGLPADAFARSVEAVMAEERRLSHSYGGRSVFGLEPPAAEEGAA